MGLYVKHKPILPFLLRVRSLGRDRKSGRLAGKLMTIKRTPGGEAEDREGRRIMDVTTSAWSETTRRISEPSTLQGTLGSLDK